MALKQHGKELLLVKSSYDRRKRSQGWRSWKVARAVVLLLVLCLALLSMHRSASSLQLPESLDDSLHTWLVSTLDQYADVEGSPADGSDPECPQQEPLDSSSFPPARTTDEQFAEQLSKAVQIDTSMGDNWPAPSEDPERWDRLFVPFREHLRETYPRIHADDGPVKLEIVNRAALIYTWKGTDENLKPILLTAHQDVVPVNEATAGDWRHPPFSGHIDDDGTVWGRGSKDAKALLVGIMATLEELLAEESEFAPKRTIIVAFGSDEEASGPQGAAHIAPRLQELYGNDSIALLLDEGAFNAPKDRYGFPIAAVAVEEKGAMHVTLRVEAHGGHSSFPPPHTSIGVLSEIITRIEAKPYAARFTSSTSASLQMLVCLRNAPLMPKAMRKALKDLVRARRSSLGKSAGNSYGKLPLKVRAALLLARATRGSDRRRQRRIEKAERRLLDVLPRDFANPLITTRAVDVVRGGTKINALPEGAEADIDSRIASWHSVEEVKADYGVLLRQAAKDFNLKLHLFGKDEEEFASNGNGKIIITEWPDALAPAPVTPTVGKDANAWRLLSSVIRDTYRTDEAGEPLRDGQSITTSPIMSLGNTDTRRYWALTRNIFRYGPMTVRRDRTGLWGNGVHTVNEHCSTKGSNMVQFYKTLILAADASTEL